MHTIQQQDLVPPRLEENSALIMFLATNKTVNKTISTTGYACSLKIYSA